MGETREVKLEPNLIGLSGGAGMDGLKRVSGCWPCLFSFADLLHRSNMSPRLDRGIERCRINENDSRFLCGMFALLPSKVWESDAGGMG